MEALRCHIPGRDTELLRQMYADAVATAHDMKQKHLEKRAETWRAFTLKQVMDGASTAHRLIKRDATPCLDKTTTGVGPSRTASPLSIVDQDLQSWRDVWLRLGEEPTAPWRQHKVVPAM